MTPTHWYCVHTRPKKEAQVAEYCHHVLGLETYYPRLRQYKTIRRARSLVTAPLFPRYLFCRFDLASSYRMVRYAPEAIDLVHVGRQPAVVDSSLVDELRSWAGDTGDILTVGSDLQPGDKVEITDGPMRGLPAVIVRAKDEHDRVAILLSFIECSAHMTISRSELRRVS